MAFSLVERQHELQRDPFDTSETIFEDVGFIRTASAVGGGGLSHSFVDVRVKLFSARNRHVRRGLQRDDGHGGNRHAANHAEK
jgi:hypothetical protein